ncbi:hypothetical protein LTLLF_169330 [Microtus ochrogaster]|uniref:Uncharacterized protein n=1 Tax=Microtus ochrogaster TaxID=79684 RepID=A0A8J6GAY9_MICOH|nr:hypothetical protein LTLLF_169330 [Microtus ochrogaster]
MVTIIKGKVEKVDTSMFNTILHACMAIKELLVGMMDLKQLVTNSSFIRKMVIYTSVWKPQPLPPASTYNEAE